MNKEFTFKKGKIESIKRHTTLGKEPFCFGLTFSVHKAKIIGLPVGHRTTADSGIDCSIMPCGIFSLKNEHGYENACLFVK